MAVLGPAASALAGGHRQPRGRHVAAVVALLSGVVDLRRHQRGAAHPGRRAGSRPPPGTEARTRRGRRRDRGEEAGRGNPWATKTILYEVDGHGGHHHHEPSRGGQRPGHGASSTRSTPPSTEADADDEVRVVILAGAGKHFSSGHDLKALSAPEPDEWRPHARHPRGQDVPREGHVLRPVQARSTTSASPPSPPCRASCVAAGLMLACMCDLIVAADDAVFSNPVLRMTGAGVELLVEPWEMGIRKAKEFLLDRRHHRRPGGVAPGSGQPGRPPRRAGRPHPGAGRADRPGAPDHGPGGEGLLNHTGRAHGPVDSWKYHFMAHHWAQHGHVAPRPRRAQLQMGPP
jgi:hypothetical protein